MQSEIDAERAYLESGDDAVLVKIAAEGYEVNKYVDAKNSNELISFLNGERGERFLGGQSGGSRALWKDDDDFLHILSGGDEDTWDIGFTMDRLLLKQITEKVKAVKA